MNPRIVFIGAGPVGLMTAIQAKLYDPAAVILMLEKYPEYRRNHPLLIEQKSFNGAHTNPEFQDLLNGIPHNICTNELEDRLLVFARLLGIQIQHEHVTNCEEIAQRYPAAEIFIGSDGSHSVVHEQVFSHKYQIQKTLQYIIEIKYEVLGDTSPLSQLTDSYFAMRESGHFVSEFVGKKRDNKTPVSIRVFVDANTYEKLKGATFKNPYHLADINRTTDTDIATVYQSIKAWLTTRQTKLGEVRVADSERITSTNLPVYASKEFAKTAYGKNWLLVGDAAFGVPFFRSLNNGIKCSTQLAKVIHAILNKLALDNTQHHFAISSSTTQSNPLEYYADYVNNLVSKENFIAEVKNAGVTSMQSSSSVVQSAYSARVGFFNSVSSAASAAASTLYPNADDDVADNAQDHDTLLDTHPESTGCTIC